ncbi:MAG: DUF3488 domain-containing protein [Deltaproteobacteria bacterium]|nr:DUF3488 domain-containing protein [Deltaproteobacteria bacterium]
MNISSYTIILTYFMTAIGVTAISLVETIEPSFTAAIATGAAFSVYFNVTKRPPIPKWLWNFLAVVLLVFFIADYAYISMSLIVSSARFLAAIFVFKLFDLKTNRDYLMAYVLVFFELLAAAASTVSIMFFALLSLFVVGGIWAMIIFNVKKDWQRANCGGKTPPGEPPGAIFGLPFFFFVLASSVAAVLTAFIMFFMMPRMELGFFERKTANAIKVLGFSDKVDLGEIGAVKTDSTIVMRVEVKGEASREFMRLRGAALERYDGKSWTRTMKHITSVKKDALGRFETGKKSKGMFEQNILLEPLETDVIFAASFPAVIEGKFPVLMNDRSGSLFVPAPPYTRLEYKAWSSPGMRVEDSPRDMSSFLDVSALSEDPSWGAIKRLALEITNGKGDDAAKASAIERYLKANYRYTLNPETGKGKIPLEDFLFYTKAGYCEHFATAMTVMLRAVNIPSRLVTGFVQGDWNRLGGYFIIRQENAHSWVEAYVKDAGGYGWTTLDPTPSAGFGSYTQPSTLSLYFDLIRWKWNRNVVHYTFSDQRKLAMVIEGRLHLFVSALKNLYTTQAFRHATQAFRPDSIRAKALSYVAVSVVIAAAIFFAALRLSRSKGKTAKTPLFYLEMQRMLRRKGIVRKTWETPLEFSERVDNSRVTEITWAFQRIRYGGAAETPSLDAIKKALEGLKKDLRQ